MNAWLIAVNTFREATRDRVLLGMVVAGMVLILGTQPLGLLALGEGKRLTVDIGLSGISMLGLLAVLMVGTNLVAKEIERKTIFNLLSRPISRPAYLVGKWAGLAGALWVVAAVLGLTLWGLLTARGITGYSMSVCQAVYLAGLELSVIAAVAVMFSSISTPVLSSLYTLGLFCVGQWCNDLRSFAAQFPRELRVMAQTFADLVPNLPLFNMRALAADGALTSPLHLGLASAYALLYCGCVIALGAAAFESRDFK